MESEKPEVLLKVDVKNAFNLVHRGAMLTHVRDKIPSVYNFLWQCYSQNSKLMYQDNLLLSEVGCQQGDPLGPVIFSLAIHPIL
ncbi:reverse transcriptase domain-containing protein, partial [Vibrio cholerae]|uniref:reverse transcriptase domain-containing protein n=1 Tax=Vibrio cholerae TaxID=666 RepID=UPI003B21E52C